MNNIKKCILITGATLLTITRSAYGVEDTLYTMLEQTDISKRVKLELGWEKMNVKTIIDKSIECTATTKKLFEEIAQDEVGAFSIKFSRQGQKAFGKKLKIIEDRPFITPDGEELTNVFIEKDFAIYLDLKQLQSVTTVKSVLLCGSKEIELGWSNCG